MQICLLILTKNFVRPDLDSKRKKNLFHQHNAVAHKDALTMTRVTNLIHDLLKHPLSPPDLISSGGTFPVERIFELKSQYFTT